MGAWDWTFVGMVFVGVSGGIIVGSYVAVGFCRGLAYELLSHPVARKVADASDKIAEALKGDGGSGFAGLATSVLGRLFGGKK